MRNTVLLLSLIAVLASCKNKKPYDEAISESLKDVAQESYEPQIEIIPISHATFVMNWDDTIFYIDPVGGAEAFEEMPTPNVILVTDIHGDHMSAKTLSAVKNDATYVIVPEAVNESIKLEVDAAEVIHNNQSTSFDGFKVTAMPMYNLTEERLKFHTKGRGNGYIIEKNGYKVYISGDTEDILEMRALEGINKAFVCMNLPYTMTVEAAASAVLEFKPNEVYPYHYRGTEGLSDVVQFKELVSKGNEDIKVNQLDWYPNR